MKKENEICEICERVHVGKHSHYFNEGTIKEVAFVFSCPGNAEKKNHYPISGKTGEAFDFLLKILEKNGIINKGYKCRYDFRITNATTNIESNSVSKRTEALYSEVLKDDNKTRLVGEIENFATIICFGVKAKSIVSKIPKLVSKNIIYFRHLSPRAFINVKGIDRTPESRAKYVFNEYVTRKGSQNPN